MSSLSSLRTFARYWLIWTTFERGRDLNDSKLRRISRNLTGKDVTENQEPKDPSRSQQDEKLHPQLNMNLTWCHWAGNVDSCHLHGDGHPSAVSPRMAHPRHIVQHRSLTCPSAFQGCSSSLHLALAPTVGSQSALAASHAECQQQPVLGAAHNSTHLGWDIPAAEQRYFLLLSWFSMLLL